GEHALGQQERAVDRTRRGVDRRAHEQTHPLLEFEIGELDLLLEPRPARKAVAPGRDELGVREAEIRREGLRRGMLRMMLAEPRQRIRVARTPGGEEILGLLAELIQVGTGRQLLLRRGHLRTSFKKRRPVRSLRQKESGPAPVETHHEAGSALSADWRLPHQPEGCYLLRLLEATRRCRSLGKILEFGLDSIPEGPLMALSVKNSTAERLARQVASETGESLTEAIIHSLEERLERLKGRRSD